MALLMSFRSQRAAKQQDRDGEGDLGDAAKPEQGSYVEASRAQTLAD